jgi:deazaflavin-dependent oxidoreductase (nitroreductase family)
MADVAWLYRSSIYRALLPRMLRLFVPAHVRLYRLFRGHVVGRLAQGFAPLLLLTTRGRRSGRKRTQIVGYVRDGSAFLIVGANGGLSSDPGWVFNLQARPDAEVQVGGERIHVRAAILNGDDRAHAWREVTGRYPFFGVYQSVVGRSIPVVRLDPEPLPLRPKLSR